MYGIFFDGCSYIETRLVKAQARSAISVENIYTDRPH